MPPRLENPLIGGFRPRKENYTMTEEQSPIIPGPITFTCPECQHSFRIRTFPRTTTVVVCSNCRIATLVHDRRGVVRDRSMENPEASGGIADTIILDPYADYAPERKKELLEAWQNAVPIPESSPFWFRRDTDGNLILYTAHEAQNSKYGWKIIRVKSGGRVSFQAKHIPNDARET